MNYYLSRTIIYLTILFVLIFSITIYNKEFIKRKLITYNDINKLNIELPFIYKVVYVLSEGNSDLACTGNACGICVCGRIKALHPERYANQELDI